MGADNVLGVSPYDTWGLFIFYIFLLQRDGTDWWACREPLNPTPPTLLLFVPFSLPPLLLLRQGEKPLVAASALAAEGAAAVRRRLPRRGPDIPHLVKSYKG